jgi:hypothetical protein
MRPINGPSSLTSEERLSEAAAILADGVLRLHVTRGLRFRDGLSESEHAEQKAFLEGLPRAEKRATEDLRAAFPATWTPRVVSGLKRPLRALCG